MLKIVNNRRRKMLWHLIPNEKFIRLSTVRNINRRRRRKEDQEECSVGKYKKNVKVLRSRSWLWLMRNGGSYIDKSFAL